MSFNIKDVPDNIPPHIVKATQALVTLTNEQAALFNQRDELPEHADRGHTTVVSLFTGLLMGIALDMGCTPDELREAVEHVISEHKKTEDEPAFETVLEQALNRGKL